MKTYLRILSFAKPYRRFIPQYLLFASLSILFGLINLTLLIPLFEVLFNQVDETMLTEMRNAPAFSLSVDYVLIH